MLEPSIANEDTNAHAFMGGFDLFDPSERFSEIFAHIETTKSVEQGARRNASLAISVGNPAHSFERCLQDTDSELGALVGSASSIDASAVSDLFGAMGTAAQASEARLAADDQARLQILITLVSGQTAANFFLVKYNEGGTFGL